MTYLTVLWIEMTPILAERFGGKIPGLACWTKSSPA
jgi:hypothetical protein